MATFALAPNTRRAFLSSAGLGMLLLAVGCPADPAKTPDDGEDPDTGEPGDSGDSATDSAADSSTDETGLDTGGGVETGDPDSGTPDETGDTSGVEEDPWGPEPTDCATPNVETGTGPFYRAGAPERTNLNPLAESGTSMRLYFRVVNARCEPIVGCFIEIWHCAPEAQYDMTSDDYRFYGVQYTDAEGKGMIETIKPPVYVDDAGEHKPHIHFQFTADGYQKIAFQCLFLEDGIVDGERNPVLDLVEGADGVKSESVVFVLSEVAG